MNRKLIGTVSAVAMAAGIGFGATQLATAETPSPTPGATASTDPATPQDGPPVVIDGHGPRGRHGTDDDAAALAEKLGLQEADVAAAVEAARESLRPTEGERPDRATDFEAARAEREAAFAKAVAEDLGIDQAKVTSALAELRAEHEAERKAADAAVLDKAVEEGTLTRAEADAVTKAVDAGIVGIRGAGHGR